MTISQMVYTCRRTFRDVVFPTNDTYNESLDRKLDLSPTASKIKKLAATIFYIFVIPFVKFLDWVTHSTRKNLLIRLSHSAFYYANASATVVKNYTIVPILNHPKKAVATLVIAVVLGYVVFINRSSSKLEAVDGPKLNLPALPPPESTDTKLARIKNHAAQVELYEAPLKKRSTSKEIKAIIRKKGYKEELKIFRKERLHYVCPRKIRRAVVQGLHQEIADINQEIAMQRRKWEFDKLQLEFVDKFIYLGGRKLGGSILETLIKETERKIYARVDNPDQLHDEGHNDSIEVDEQLRSLIEGDIDRNRNVLKSNVTTTISSHIQRLSRRIKTFAKDIKALEERHEDYKIGYYRSRVYEAELNDFLSMKNLGLTLPDLTGECISVVNKTARDLSRLFHPDKISQSSIVLPKEDFLTKFQQSKNHLTGPYGFCSLMKN